MSDAACPYDVGAPSDWLRNASLPGDAKACAVPTSEGCTNNAQVLSDCCSEAVRSENATAQVGTWSGDSAAVCSLPTTASEQTSQQCQDCILNTYGGNGGFRCNDVNTTNKGEFCHSLIGALIAPIATTPDTQVCVTGERANTSSFIEQCCGSAPVAFEDGCWQHCVAPTNESVAACISRGLSAIDVTTPNVGCMQSSSSLQDSTGASDSGASSVGCFGLGSSLGLVVVAAYAAGLL